MNSDSIFASLSPGDLHLPAKFTSYRGPQREALEWLIEACHAPVSAALLPTGIGKTLLAVSLAKLSRVKTVYLVATKALQAQVLADFESVGMVSVKGRGNYKCPNYDTCDRGYEEECSRYNTDGCDYSNAVEAAKGSDLIVTNYAYWLHARKHNASALEYEGWPVELLIADEAHRCEAEVTSFASVKIYERELGKTGALFDRSGVMETTARDEWTVWANGQIERSKAVKDKIEIRLPNSYRHEVRWKEADDLQNRSTRISKMSGNFVWQFDDRGHVTFSPIRVSPWTKQLFADFPRVLLMSASLNSFVLRLLMGDAGCDYDYRAWPPVFSQSNAPVYHIPTRKLSWRSTDADYKAIIEKADAIIDRRTDRKGIIHTVSYARSKRTLQYSRHAARFIWNETGSALADKLVQFRNSDDRNILVTPSVEEGFDFPDTEAEYQILLKFPFPNETNRVIKERCLRIPGYRLQYAAQKVTQIRGRAVRSYTDRSELFILDNSVAQLNGQEGRGYMPPGFRMWTVNEIPKAPPRIVL